VAGKSLELRVRGSARADPSPALAQFLLPPAAGRPKLRPAPVAIPILASRRTLVDQREIKRLLDIGLAVAGLVMAAPLMGVLWLVLRLDLGRPVLFRQVRPGRGGKLFTLVKFRTMRDSVDAAGRPLPDPQRLTRLGRLLRRTSLDELPSLWNVLRGEMSLVGPRPLLPEYLPRYTPRQARRHETRPGITGWAQVNGRQQVVFSRRLELDVWYVENWSLMLDLRILLLTIARVLGRSGVLTDQQIEEVDDLGLNEGVVYRGPRKAA